MNTLYEQMVSAYQAETDRDLWNAKYEVTQQITLAGLHRGGFETATRINKHQCGQRGCNPFCRRPPRPRHLVQRLFPAARRDDPVRVRRETRPNYQKMSYKQRFEEKITKKGRPYSKKYYLCDLIFET